MLDKLIKIIDHNRYAAFGWITLAIAMIGAVGCNPTTISPQGVEVTSAQLTAEHQVSLGALDDAYAEWTGNVQALEIEGKRLESKAKRLEAQYLASDADLQVQQQRIDDALGGLFGIVSASIPGPYLGIATAGMGIITLLTGRDNRRKDKVIVKLKNGGGAAPPA